MFDKDFISPRLQGRTGNMIFQVAHSLAKSLEYNKQLVIFRESAVADIEHNIFKKLNIFNANQSIIDNCKIIESPFHFTELTSPSFNTPIRYSGWFQS